MLNRMRMIWFSSFLLSVLFLPAGYADAIPGRAKQATPATPAPSVSPAPRPISEAKRSLINQLLETTGGRQQYEQMQQTFVMQTQQQIQPIVDQIVNGDPNLSPTERSALAARLSNSSNSLLTQFSEVLRTAITYDELLEQVYYPVYDRYFTEADLNGLITFYQTPLGQRLIAVSPQIAQASQELSNQVFAPRIAEIIGRLIRQQMNGGQEPQVPSSKAVTQRGGRVEREG